MLCRNINYYYLYLHASHSNNSHNIIRKTREKSKTK